MKRSTAAMYGCARFECSKSMPRNVRRVAERLKPRSSLRQRCQCARGRIGHEMASYEAIALAGCRRECRNFLRTARDCDRTARMEATTRWWIDRTGRFSEHGQAHACALSAWVRDGYGCDQGSRIGMQ